MKGRGRRKKKRTRSGEGRQANLILSGYKDVLLIQLILLHVLTLIFQSVCLDLKESTLIYFNLKMVPVYHPPK